MIWANVILEVYQLYINNIPRGLDAYVGVSSSIQPCITMSKMRKSIRCKLFPHYKYIHAYKEYENLKTLAYWNTPNNLVYVQIKLKLVKATQRLMFSELSFYVKF